MNFEWSGIIPAYSQNGGRQSLHSVRTRGGNGFRSEVGLIVLELLVPIRAVRQAVQYSSFVLCCVGDAERRQCTDRLQGLHALTLH